MTKPKTVKPKRQWKMWAMILSNGELFKTTHTEDSAWDGWNKKRAKKSGYEVKKVLVTEL